MPTQAADLAFGTSNETNVLETLQTFFQQTLQRQGGYSVMDYTNPTRTLFVELKTRRIRHNQYPTAIIGRNKVQFCNDPNKEYYFVFCYTDGLYYIKYEKDLFDSFEVSDYTRGERTDCENRVQEVVYIPHEHLTRFPDS